MLMRAFACAVACCCYRAAAAFVTGLRSVSYRINESQHLLQTVHNSHSMEAALLLLAIANDRHNGFNLLTRAINATERIPEQVRGPRPGTASTGTFSVLIYLHAERSHLIFTSRVAGGFSNKFWPSVTGSPSYRYYQNNGLGALGLFPYDFTEYSVKQKSARGPPSWLRACGCYSPVCCY
ncbi:hypothetical protein J3F84DRAFT_291949 [Trichoderma pleuroticola]